MSYKTIRVLTAVAGAVLLASAAGAQVAVPGYGGAQLPKDARATPHYTIKRATVRGTIKSIDVTKKQVMVDAGHDKKAREMPVDVGPCIIKAGKGSATLADFKVGDKISVYGETTVQGGLRAMEVTVP